MKTDAQRTSRGYRVVSPVSAYEIGNRTKSGIIWRSRECRVHRCALGTLREDLVCLLLSLATQRTSYDPYAYAAVNQPLLLLSAALLSTKT